MGAVRDGCIGNAKNISAYMEVAETYGLVRKIRKVGYERFSGYTRNVTNPLKITEVTHTLNIL